MLDSRQLIVVILKVSVILGVDLKTKIYIIFFVLNKVYQTDLHYVMQLLLTGNISHKMLVTLQQPQ